MNIYYSPEDYGLEIVKTFEEPPQWDFNMLVLWKDSNDQLYALDDSGCSCPSPFENVYNLDDLIKVQSYTHLDTLIDDWINTPYRREPESGSENYQTEKTEFLARAIREGWIV